MEPVSAALLVALASSVGSSAGQQAWASLRDLLARPFRRAPGTADADDTSGEAQWAVLAAAPGDEGRAGQLAAVLAARADRDPGFAQAATVWHRTAQQALAGSGDTHNSVSGGTQGAVVQARDVQGGVHFGAPVTPPLPPRGDA